MKSNYVCWQFTVIVMLVVPVAVQSDHRFQPVGSRPIGPVIGPEQ